MSGLKVAFRRQWFLVSLLLIVAATLLDRSRSLAAAGQWLGSLGGAKACVMAMFLCSGLSLNGSSFMRGIADIPVILAALALIFIFAPLLAALLTMLPLDEGLRIGIILIAIMPTTLSSGVVMAGLAGGNTATAIVITIIASWLGIVTIPVSLALLTGIGGDAGAASFDKAGLAIRLVVIVVLPLMTGMLARKIVTSLGRRVIRTGIISQCLVLTVIWIAVSRSYETLQQAPAAALWSSMLAALFHLALLLTAVALSKTLRFGPGRRETVWFMGAQKTLPIALLLQTALFPHYGNALVYCVCHHIIHLGADSYLAGVLKRDTPYR